MKALNDVLIVSPSGKLYGSERVLLDYINNTSLNFDIAVPAGSDLQSTLSGIGKEIKVTEYQPSHLALFYLRLSIWLFQGRYKKVYINEAGHVKYILLLCRLFPSVFFTVHVRIVEDARADRWKTAIKKMPGNLTVVTISDYIAGLMHVPNITVADPFIFSNGPVWQQHRLQQSLRIGIIGRVSFTKGIDVLPYLLAEIEKQRLTETVLFHLYGDMGEDIDSVTKDILRTCKSVFLHGYVKESEAIYGNLDVVLHLSETEPLGRIFFEAVNHELPFIGISAGGIGETARKYGYTELMVEPAGKEIMAIELIRKLLLVKEDLPRYTNAIINIKGKMRQQMGIEHYCTQLDLQINRPGKN